MFSNSRRKKIRSRIIATVAGSMVLAFGVWLNYQSKAGDELQSVSDEISQEAVDTSGGETDSSGADDASDVSTGSGTNSGDAIGFIVKVDGDAVKVFTTYKDGTEKLYLITDVAYELLSTEDQKMFTQGVDISSEDELYQFLENFD